MPAAPTLPPALRSLLETGGALLRRSTSGRAGMARVADVLPEDALPTALRRLPAELRAAQEAARERLAPKEVERVLKGAWRTPPGKALDDFDDEPLAVTPAAQVHAGVHEGTPVAIKVRRPGLAAAVRNDLALLDALAVPLRQVFAALDAGAVLREVRETALDELDLEHEGSTLRQARRHLRGVAGLHVPAPLLELSSDDVLVTERVEGPTLADAEPDDGAAVARTLLAAHLTAARAGLVLTDPRPGHVVLRADGTVALLGAGLARPVARERVAAFLDAAAALRDADEGAFTAAVAGRLELLPPAAASKAYILIDETLGTLLRGPATLDGPALAAAGERALDRLDALLDLAREVTPHPQDLALARSTGQLATLLARLGATEDWGALVTGG